MSNFELIVKARRNPSSKTTGYGVSAAPVKAVTSEELCQEIVDETSLSRADVKSLLAALEKLVIEYLKNGRSIRLGDLGAFHATVSAPLQSSREEVKADQVKAVKIQFTKSGYLRKAFDVKQMHFTLKK